MLAATEAGSIVNTSDENTAVTVVMVMALTGCGKRRMHHSGSASLAVSGAAVRRKAKEKADSSPVQKPNGVRNDTLSSFPGGC
jgi:hypothetical protein